MKLPRRQAAPLEQWTRLVGEHLRLEAALRRLSPAAHHDKIRLFRDLDPDGAGQDVPDPYYGDADGFDEVLDIVTRAATALLAELTTPAR